MIFFCLGLCLLSLSCSKSLRLPYDHAQKVVTLFTASNRPVSLHLSFETRELLLHDSLKNESLFLNKNKKFEVDGSAAKFEYRIKAGLREHEEGVLGSVGIGEGGALYGLVRKALNSTGAKLEVRHKEGVINAEGENCKYPVFLPLMVTLSESNTHSYAINSFSTLVAPDSSFLGVIQKSKSPFEATPKELQQEVTVALRDRVLSMPISQLLHCGKFSTSDSYECELKDQKVADVGGLLFEFDPTFCGSGLELDTPNESSWEFHYSHLGLLILQFLLLWCLVKEERVAKMVNSALGLKTQ